MGFEMPKNIKLIRGNNLLLIGYYLAGKKDWMKRGGGRSLKLINESLRER